MNKKIRYIAFFLLVVLLSSCSKIDVSPSIEQVRSICDLATLKCYYHNVAKFDKEAGTGIQSIGEKSRKLWIEYTGTVTIGVDMSKVKMSVSDDVVTVELPNAKLLSIGVDQSSLNEESYIITSDGLFNKNKITADDQGYAISTAQSKMKNQVLNDRSLLLSAQNRAKELIENYIRQIGELSGKNYSIEWVYIE